MARGRTIVLGLILAACGPGQASDGGASACEQFELLPPFDFGWTWPPRDLDGDGHLDFIGQTDGPFGPLEGGLDLTFSWGDGALNFETAVGPSFQGYPDPSSTWIVFADIDGDGLDDLVHHASTAFDVGPNEIVFHTARQTMPRVFAMGVEATPAGVEHGAGVVAADLDGDGDDELVARGELPGSEQHWVYTIATEAGTLGPIVAGFESSWSNIEVADLDGDGRDELMLLHDGYEVGSPSSLSVVEAEADGKLVEIAIHETGPGTGVTPADMQAADFDGDGALDLFVENLDRLRLFRGNGDDTFSDAGQLAIPNIDELVAGCESSDCAPIRQARAGDFDHDGAAELVIVLGTITVGTPVLAVWLVDDVLGQEPDLVAYDAISDDFGRFTVADFDADGCDDLLYPRDPYETDTPWYLRRCPLGRCD